MTSRLRRLTGNIIGRWDDAQTITQAYLSLDFNLI